AQEVHEGSLHRAGPAGREHEDVLLRLEEPAQPLSHAAEDGLELRRAVVDDGPRHPQGEPLRDGRRTRGEQADLLHGAASSDETVWIGALARCVKTAAADHGKASAAAVRLSGHRRRARPGRAAVSLPSSKTMAPFTITVSIPSANCAGCSKVARSRTRVGSKSTRSAAIPGRIRPRSGSFTRRAGSDVIRRTASSMEKSFRSRA